MTNELNDTIDYVCTVAAMSWLQGGQGGSPEQLIAVTERADRLGESLTRHLVDAGALHRSAPYRWRPAYELMLEPLIDQALSGTAESTFTELRSQARREQLDRCTHYLLELCRQAPDWAGSRVSTLLETFAERIADRRAPNTVPSSEPWVREIITPTKDRTPITDES